MEAFQSSLPSHLRLSDRNILSLSGNPAFAGYLALHTWFFQGCCDLFRISLPGLARETACANFLRQIPSELTEEWCRLAVTYAVLMARNWASILLMKESGALSLPGALMPVSPESCVSTHQCTKILQIAKSYKLYSDLRHPVSGQNLPLNDEIVDDLCQSNVRFLDDLASNAPIAAVVRRDVKEMISRALRQRSADNMQQQVPITSDVQREKILSRYHTLAMSIAASNSSRPGNTDTADPSAEYSTVPSAGVSREILDEPVTSQRAAAGVSAAGWIEASSSQHQSQQQEVFRPTSITSSDPAHSQIQTRSEMPQAVEGFWSAPASTDLAHQLHEYTIAPSEFSMDIELDHFLANVLSQTQEEPGQFW